MRPFLFRSIPIAEAGVFAPVPPGDRPAVVDIVVVFVGIPTTLATATPPVVPIPRISSVVMREVAGLAPSAFPRLLSFLVIGAGGFELLLYGVGTETADDRTDEGRDKFGLLVLLRVLRTVARIVVVQFRVASPDGGIADLPHGQAPDEGAEETGAYAGRRRGEALLHDMLGLAERAARPPAGARRRP